MARYLTPSKVGLLVLVSLYCDSNVPNKALVPILSFALSHLIPSSTSDSSHRARSRSVKGVLDIEDFELLTRPHQSNRPGRSLFDLFLNRLWSIDSLHVLHAFFEELNEYLQPVGSRQEEKGERILLSRTSPLGMFFRRAHLEFTRLQFDDTGKLWVGFLKFRAPTESVWRKRNPHSPGPSFDKAIAEYNLQNPDRIALAAYGATNANDLEDAGPSVEDVERLLEFDLEKLQRG